MLSFWKHVKNTKLHNRNKRHWWSPQPKKSNNNNITTGKALLGRLNLLEQNANRQGRTNAYAPLSKRAVWANGRVAGLAKSATAPQVEKNLQALRKLKANAAKQLNAFEKSRVGPFILQSGKLVWSNAAQKEINALKQRTLNRQRNLGLNQNFLYSVTNTKPRSRPSATLKKAVAAFVNKPKNVTSNQKNLLKKELRRITAKSQNKLEKWERKFLNLYGAQVYKLNHSNIYHAPRKQYLYHMAPRVW